VLETKEGELKKANIAMPWHQHVGHNCDVKIDN
jgi:hypothetical protein